MSSERGRGPAVGRGDLLRAFAKSPEAKDAIAELLGYSVQERGTGLTESSEAPKAGPSPMPDDFDVPLWRAETLVPLRDPEEAPPPLPPPRNTIALRDIGRLPNVPPPSPPPPIATWARLRRTMEGVHRRARPIGEVDVAAIVRKIGRGTPIVRIPREDRQVAVNRMIVILDRCERLLPFWGDQEAICHQLKREVGDDRLRVAVWREGPPDEIPRLQEGDAVLLLGDLGHYGGAHVQRAWARLAAEFRRQGECGAALLPVPASRWHSALTRHWRAFDWANPTRGAARAAPIEEELTRRRDDLLALLSWTVRTELELVREVRSWLPATHVDVGTEADLWNHPEIGRHSGGLLVPDSLRRTAQDRLLELLADAAWKARFPEIVELVRRRHAWLPQEIWVEEARALELLGHGDCLRPDERERVHWFTHGVRVFLKREETLGKSIDVAGWAKRGLLGRVPELGWSHSTLGPDLAATLDFLRREDEALPPGLTVGMLPSSQVEGPARRLGLTDPRVDGDGDVEQRKEPQPGRSWLISSAAGGRGSPLVTVVGRGSRVSVKQMGQPGAMAYAVASSRSIPRPDAESIEIETDCDRVTLSLRGTPSWAHAAGRDRFGCWAAFRVGNVEQRMRWIPPGRFWMGSPESELGYVDLEGPQHPITITRGYWLAETPCTQALWQAVMGRNPSRFKGLQRPVELISWESVQKFMARLDATIKLESDWAFRLPSEAEWEYACRAGTTKATYGGDLADEVVDPVLDEIAWYVKNSGGETHDVGQKARNPWGLYDTLGNVSEWCDDMFTYNAASNPFADLARPGRFRVIRGGGYSSVAGYVRAAYRNGLEPSSGIDWLGFRLVRGQKLPKQDEQT